MLKVASELVTKTAAEKYDKACDDIRQQRHHQLDTNDQLGQQPEKQFMDRAFNVIRTLRLANAEWLMQGLISSSLDESAKKQKAQAIRKQLKDWPEAWGKIQSVLTAKCEEHITSSVDVFIFCEPCSSEKVSLKCLVL